MSAGERLYRIERAEARLAAHAQRVQITRNRLRDEMRALRCGLTNDEGRAYQALQERERQETGR